MQALQESQHAHLHHFDEEIVEKLCSQHRLVLMADGNSDYVYLSDGLPVVRVFCCTTNYNFCNMQADMLVPTFKTCWGV